MNFKNLIWLAAILSVCIGVISIFAQDEPKTPLEDQDQNQNLPGQQNLRDDQQGVTNISGTVHCVLDDQGNVKSCEIKDEKGMSYSIDIKAKDSHCLGMLHDARIRATGRMIDGGVAGTRTFQLESYEATVGIAGKLVEKGESELVLEEINFQGSPKSFKVLNGKEEVKKLGVPFNKEIKANGTITMGDFKQFGEGQEFREGQFPSEGVKPEDRVRPEEGTKPEESVKPEDRLPEDDGARLPQEGTKPEDVKPEDKSVLDDKSKLDDKNNMDREIGMDKKADSWTIRINSYEPLEYIVGMVSSEKGDAGDMQIKLEEEEKGIIFKEKGRTFEVANKGRGAELRRYEGQKIKAYGTLSKNEHGSWLLHVLAYQPEGGKEGQDIKKDESKKDDAGNPEKE